MLIRVNKEGLNKKKKRKEREGETYDQEKEEDKALGNCLLDQILQWM